jgi:ELWxxDGT repeat protein
MAYGAELWKMVGMTATQVEDIFPGSGSSSPSFLTEYNGAVYFTAFAGPFDVHLFSLMGINQFDIWMPSILHFTPIQVFNEIVFSGIDSSWVRTWKFDGNTISLVADINPAVRVRHPGFRGIMMLYFSRMSRLQAREIRRRNCSLWQIFYWFRQF